MWAIFTRPFSHWCEHHAVYESRSDVHTLILIQNCRHTRCAHRQFKYFYYTTLISITITLHIAASQPAKNVIILSDWWGIYCNSKAFRSNLNANWWHQLGILFLRKLLLLFAPEHLMMHINGFHDLSSLQISKRTHWMFILRCFWSQLAFLFCGKSIYDTMFINRFAFWHRLCITTATASHATETIETMIEIFNIYHHHLNSINILSIIIYSRRSLDVERVGWKILSHLW